MRLLDKSKKAPTLADLGLSEDMRAKLDEIIRRPTGAILARARPAPVSRRRSTRR
jgi:type II secretory ATPase GspE/PulE/Tfp pilus assembly ATPase PilB-like protein